MPETQVYCSHCGTGFNVAVENAGKQATCARCNQTFAIQFMSVPPVAQSATDRDSPIYESQSASVSAAVMADQWYQSTRKLREVPRRQRTSGMAITAGILGGLALLLSWIPFVGLVLALLAFSFGLASVIVATRLGGVGVGFPVGGTLLSVVAVAAGTIFTYQASDRNQSAAGSVAIRANGVDRIAGTHASVQSTNGSYGSAVDVYGLSDEEWDAIEVYARSKGFLEPRRYRTALLAMKAAFVDVGITQPSPRQLFNGIQAITGALFRLDPYQLGIFLRRSMTMAKGAGIPVLTRETAEKLDQMDLL